jgi:hypothetical protein
VGDEIAVTLLILLVTPGYEVDGDPAPTSQVVQRGGRSGQRQWLYYARAVGDHDLQMLRPVEHRGRDGPTVRPDRTVTDQYPVKTTVLVRRGNVPQVVRLDHRTVQPVHHGAVYQGPRDLRGFPRPDHSNDL